MGRQGITQRIVLLSVLGLVLTACGLDAPDPGTVIALQNDGATATAARSGELNELATARVREAIVLTLPSDSPNTPTPLPALTNTAVPISPIQPLPTATLLPTWTPQPTPTTTRPLTPTPRGTLDRPPSFDAYPGLDDTRYLARSPANFESVRFAFSGKVFNIHDDGMSTWMQVYGYYLDATTYSYDNAPIYVRYNAVIPFVGVNDEVLIYGVGHGWYTFTNVYGGRVSQPLVDADYVELWSTYKARIATPTPRLVTATPMPTATAAPTATMPPATSAPTTTLHPTVTREPMNAPPFTARPPVTPTTSANNAVNATGSAIAITYTAKPQATMIVGATVKTAATIDAKKGTPGR